MNWLRQIRLLRHNAHREVPTFDREESTQERLRYRWERARLERRIAIVEAQVRARGGRAS
jgi:hypothetical protein